MKKSRILLIVKFLLDHTDEVHDVSSKDLIVMLAKEGIPTVDRRTVDADIRMLIASGFDISTERRNGIPVRYKLLSRDFDTVELKILIDAVAASRFINPERSRVLIRTLASLACIHDREGLQTDTASLLSIKNAIGQNMYVADTLYRAIISKQKISYQMVDHRVPDKKCVPHRAGHIYIVSPYAMVWNHDMYYLVAYDEERSGIITPRVDRIRYAEITNTPIDPMPADFDIGYYYSINYKMYSGPETEVTLLCKNDLLDQVIDRFGMEFSCVSVSENAFTASVRTSIGPTFFGWLFQYAGEMQLIGPEETVTQYNEHLKKALSEIR